MNTVGILVQFQPEQYPDVQQQIVQYGCEVHVATTRGKMVVTLEHNADDVIADTIVALQNIDGVLSASMVYHHTDDEAFSS